MRIMVQRLHDECGGFLSRHGTAGAAGGPVR
jgi:hypothetical protein